MNVYSAIQIGLFLTVLLLLVKPLGWYMARVYEGKPCGLDRAIGWLERAVYRVCGIDPAEEMIVGIAASFGSWVCSDRNSHPYRDPDRNSD